MRHTRGESGLTWGEVLVLVAIVLVCLALFLPLLSRSTSSHPTLYCKSNLHQLGLGIENYNTDYRVMPSIHRNTWWLAALYMGFSPREEDPFIPDERHEAPPYFRCPEDRFATDKTNGCSYSPNYQVASPFLPESGTSIVDNADARNAKYSPFSNYKLSGDREERVIQGEHLGLKNADASAPDTILLIENWDPENRVFFCGSRGLKAQPPVVEVGAIICPRPALEDYYGPGAGQTVGGKWVMSTQTRWGYGAYLSLRAYSREAYGQAKELRLDSQTYHPMWTSGNGIPVGWINVLFADQHAETLECSRLFQSPIFDTSDTTPKVKNPLWTRLKD